MKSFVLALPCCCLALLPLNARGDIAEAEDAAWRMGVKYRDRGFYLQDVQQYGIMKVGNDDYRKFKLRIVKGLDYVFLTALDTAVDLVPGKPIPRKVAEKLEDIDLYVYSDVGQLIMSDSRDQDREGDAAPDGSKEKPFVLSMAGVQFRADYNGEVDVYLQIYNQFGMADPRPVGWYVLVGNRGTAFAPPGGAPPAPGATTPPSLPTPPPVPAK